MLQCSNTLCFFFVFCFVETKSKTKKKNYDRNVHGIMHTIKNKNMSCIQQGIAVERREEKRIRNEKRQQQQYNRLHNK